MRRIYTGPKYSLNKFKGNFHFCGKEDTTFPLEQPHYFAMVDSDIKQIYVYFALNYHAPAYAIRIIKIPPIKASECLSFETQADLMEFLEINDLLLPN